MMRVAVYARYSSDSQREASIDDQVRRCRSWIERERAIEAAVFTDYAISGASADRAGFRAMVEAARSGLFDVILSEALDRISRDQEHVAGFYKQIRFLGIRVVTLSEGEISELHVGLKGTMNALFLKDLGEKTHRGLEGRIKAGRSAGGLSYGYKVARQITANGAVSTGERTIDEDEAAVVRRIFSLYVSGISPRAIAHQLNGEKVLGPRGGKWTASLILGNAARGTGILRNRLYAGEIVWNRQHFLKDPATGKRVARPNPREQWIIEPAAGLRIIDDKLWTAAQNQLIAIRNEVTVARIAEESSGASKPAATIGARLGKARRPAWPLAGLVRCGLCNGPLTVMGSGGRLGCANHVERRICSNNRSILRDKLLARVLEGLKHRLLAPELVERFVETYVSEVNAANREQASRRARLGAEQAKIARQIKTILDTIKEIGGSRSLVDDLRKLEARQDEIAAEQQREASPEPVPDLHPNLPAIYRRRVELLEEALAEPEVTAAAAEALRTLIDAITLHPEEGRGNYRLELRGDLAAFMHLADRPAEAPVEQPKARSVSATGSVCSVVMVPLVAGTGFGRELWPVYC